MYKDKDYGLVVETLGGVADEWYVAEFDSPRALKVGELDQQLQSRGFISQAFTTVVDALQAAINASYASDRLVVTGSFVTVSEVLSAG